MPAKCPMCCCQTGKLSTSSNFTKWHRQRQRRPSSPPDSVSWSLRSSPSQTEECINCFAEFLSVFMDNFPCGPPSPPPLQHFLSAPSPHLKASLQSVFERQVQRPRERERETRQVDALCTLYAMPSISPTNQCNLCSICSITVILADEKITVKRKHHRTRSLLLPWNNNGT